VPSWRRRGIHRPIDGRAASDYTFRPAEAVDAPAVSRLVAAAYGHYVERIGGPPGPMTLDYAEVIRDRAVTIAEHDGEMVGLLVVGETEEGFALENVAVDPDHQGRGLGRALLERAEAETRRAGFDSIYLYTHEQMTENLELYARIGYREYDRRQWPGFALVFMRKPLA